jgi:hypothetical protein
MSAKLGRDRRISTHLSKKATTSPSLPPAPASRTALSMSTGLCFTMTCIPILLRIKNVLCPTSVWADSSFSLRSPLPGTLRLGGQENDDPCESG